MSENDNGIGVFRILFIILLAVMMVVSLLVLGQYVEVGKSGLLVDTSSWGIFSWIVFVISALVLLLATLLSIPLIIKFLIFVAEKLGELIGHLVVKLKLWWIKTSQRNRDIVICIPWIFLAITLLLFYYCR